MTIAVWGRPHEEFPDGDDATDRMARRLDDLQAAGVDRYFANVAVPGAHYFESETLGPPVHDVLAPLMAAGERVGVQIHPVLGLGGPPGVGRKLYQPSLEFSDVPERVLSWACAAWGENHERAVLVANELLERYAPGGLHLDYSRYPDADVLRGNPCACERCRQVRLRWLGKPYPEPEDMRKPGVLFKEMQMRMEFVRAFVESVRGVCDLHSVRLSAAVRPRYCEDALEEGQDWAEWCADALLDEVCPMTFRLSFDRFARLVAQHRRLVADAPVLWMEGIGLLHEGTRLDFDAFNRQVWFAIEAGADGVCISDAGALDAVHLQVLGELARA